MYCPLADEIVRSAVRKTSDYPVLNESTKLVGAFNATILRSPGQDRRLRSHQTEHVPPLCLPEQINQIFRQTGFHL